MQPLIKKNQNEKREDARRYLIFRFFVQQRKRTETEEDF